MVRPVLSLATDAVLLVATDPLSDELVVYSGCSGIIDIVGRGACAAITARGTGPAQVVIYQLND